MQDSIEADLLTAHLAPFDRDPAAWADAYITAMSRLEPAADPQRVASAARVAWRSHGWAHPMAVAHLEHEVGPLGDD
jgi:hypothetical protein